MLDIPSIVSENKRRIDKLFAPYDPIVGTGGLLKREKIVLDDLGEFYLPIEFFNTQIGESFASVSSLTEFKNEFKLRSIDDAFSIFINERVRHDFEFWCAYAIKIKPKSGGDDIPFVLSAPQRKLHLSTYEPIVNQKPIRKILVKSRQWGGSTCTQFEMCWIQLFHKSNWNSLIAAHLNQAAITIRGMIENATMTYPAELPPFNIKRYKNAENIKIIPDRKDKITIGSIESPNSIRAQDIAMFHGSEIAYWTKTEGREPEELIRAILGSIPRLPFSMEVLESTANGVGNYFHRTWQKANADGIDWNGRTPVFVSWIEDKNNFEQFRDQNEMTDFILSMSDYEWTLWELGATVEGINFYRNKLREYNNDEWRMKSEFPTTAEEAFQSSGHPVFYLPDIIRIETTCCDPIFKGDIKSDAREGKDAFNNIRLEPNPNGFIWIWSMPEPFIEIEGKKYIVENRHVGFADIGGKGTKADFSELTIVDKLDMLWGGLPEIAAQWHGHLDQDLAAWEWAKLSYLYGKALLAVEENKLDKKKTEGDHFLTVLDSIGPYYPNLFVRETVDKIKNTIEKNYGWWETHASKVQTVDFLNKLLRERGYIERDYRATAQMKMFEHKPDGTMGAVEGQKDDMVTTRKGSLYIALSMSDPPRLIPMVEGTKSTQRKVVGMTTI